MASSKLKAKSVDRTNLYYGKFEYRLVVESPNMFYTWSCKTIEDYRARILEICTEYDENVDRPGFMTWRKPKPVVTDDEFELIENLFNLEKKYKIKQDFTFRREGCFCNVYTSNINVIKDVLSFYPSAEITKVDLAPTGIKYFKKDPPATYRAYMTNNRMSPEFKLEMLEYLKRTPDVRPSNAFYTYLHRVNHHYHVWLWDTYFVDYDDDKNLMMMTLMFPGMIGKKYKLEKK